jgi:protein TonB
MGYMDSIWTEYNLEGKVLSRGWYEKNKRDSIWEFFDDKGEIDQKIDFTNNSILLYRTLFANHVFKIMSGDSCILSKLDRPPLYIGGASRFSNYFRNEITVPLHKPDDKVLGTVHVAFTIDSLGVTSNHHALKGISKICREEAVRVIKSIPDQWMPGVFNGRNVTVEYIVVVVFDENTRTMEF